MNTRFQCHYDSLKVTRDAPAEVIRAAYRSLSQKHHPDKNRGDQEAARLMSRLNSAYSVLSDEELRKQYDLQIQQEQWARDYPDVYSGAADDSDATAASAASSGREAGPAGKAATGMAEGATGSRVHALLQRLRHYASGRDGKIAAVGFGALVVALVTISWSVWKDQQSMLRLEQAAIHAPAPVIAPEAESHVAPGKAPAVEATGKIAKAKPAHAEAAESRGSSSAPVAAVAPASPAPVPKAQPAPSAPTKASDYERLTAMLKSMGLGLHKLDLPAPASNEKKAATPAKSAEPAKAAVAVKSVEPPKAVVTANASPAPAPLQQASRPAAPPETTRPREETERPAAPEPARVDAKVMAEASRAAPAASAPAGSAAPRQPVIIDLRACAPSYPPVAHSNGESGTVQLALLVGSDGRVIESKLRKSSGSSELDKAARKALSQCRFKAGSGDRGAEPVWTALEYVFSLD